MNNGKLCVYAVYDIVSGLFRAPHTFPCDAEAKRSLVQVLRSGDTELSRFPKDFEYHRIAYYDQETGNFEPCNVVVADSRFLQFVVSGDYDNPQASLPGFDETPAPEVENEKN